MRNSGKSITAVVNDFTVNYNDEGPDDAPVVIFIHGFPFNKSIWHKQVEQLKNNYRVITYDVRGHGKSTSGKQDFSIELFTEDLIRLIDLLELKHITLCGLSMGGYIALNTVEKYPGLFQALVLCDTQCTADTKEAKEKRWETIENIRESGVELFANESISKFFTPTSILVKRDEIRAVREMILGTPLDSLYKTLKALANRPETCSKLSEIKMPVLIMSGKEDEIISSSVALLMKKDIEGSVLHLIEHAAHLPNIENPIAFNNDLKIFLDKVYSEAIIQVESLS